MARELWWVLSVGVHLILAEEITNRFEMLLESVVLLLEFLVKSLNSTLHGDDLFPERLLDEGRVVVVPTAF